MKKSKTRGKSTTGGSKKDSSLSNALDVDLTINAAEFLPGLLETKWQEIIEEEERDLMILEIRDEIVNDAIEIVYNNYLERQTMSFAVHCSALAWIKLLDWYFIQRDPGEPYIDGPAWSTDEEPAPIKHDTWAGKVLPIKIPPEETEPVVSPEPSMSSITGETIYPLKAISSLTDSQRMMLEEEIRSTLARNLSRSLAISDRAASSSMPLGTEQSTERYSVMSVRRRSTFSRVLTLPKERLPKSDVEMESQKKTLLPDEEAGKINELMNLIASMKPVPVDGLPEDRIDIKYTITSLDMWGGDASNKGKGKKKKPQGGQRDNKNKPNVIMLK